MQRMDGGEMAGPEPDFGLADAEVETRFRKIFGYLKVKDHEPIGALDAECGGQIGDVGHTDVADGVPVLAESLRFARSQEGEVRLIVGVGARHELYVRAIAVGEA